MLALTVDQLRADQDSTPPSLPLHKQDHRLLKRQRRVRSGVRGTEGQERRSAFSYSFRLMQGVPGLQGTATGNIRSDYVGLHRPAGRVSACCTRHVLGSPAYQLDDGLVQVQVRLAAFPRTHHIPPTLPVQQSGLHRAAGTTLQPSVICSKRVTVKGVRWKLGGRHAGHSLTSGFPTSSPPS